MIIIPLYQGLPTAPGRDKISKVLNALKSAQITDG